MSEPLILLLKLPFALLPLYMITRREKKQWLEENPEFKNKSLQRWGAERYPPNRVRFSFRNHLIAFLWACIVIFPHHMLLD